jgi:hypothetical protein
VLALIPLLTLILLPVLIPAGVHAVHALSEFRRA